MERAARLWKALQAKSSEGLLTVLTDIYQTCSEKVSEDLMFLTFPALVQVVTMDYGKKEKVLGFSILCTLLKRKLKRFSLEVLRLCKKLVQYIISEDSDYEDCSAEVLFNLIQSEVIFKSLELRLPEFIQLFVVLRDRLASDSSNHRYLDLVIAAQAQTSSKVSSHFISLKVISINRLLCSDLKVSVKKNHLMDLSVLFELSPYLKNGMKANDEFKQTVLELCSSQPDAYLDNLNKFLELGFISPEETLSILDFKHIIFENRVGIEILELIVTKEARGVKEIINDEMLANLILMLEKNSDVDVDRAAAIASLLIAVAHKPSYQPQLKQILKSDRLRPVISRLLDDFFSGNKYGEEAGISKAFQHVVLLFATMSKICGNFLNEFTKLVSEQKTLEILSTGLLEGDARSRVVVLRIAGFLGFDRDKFCQTMASRDVSAVTPLTNGKERQSVCPSEYEPSFRDVEAILAHHKQRLPSDHGTSELMELYDLQIAELEDRISGLGNNLEDAHRKISRERAICAKQFRHLASANELLSLRESELKLAKEDLKSALEQLDLHEEEKRELEHKARKEVSLLRHQISDLSVQYETALLDLKRTSDQVRKLQAQLQEAKKSEVKFKEATSELQSLLETERAARENLKSKNAELEKELEVERERLHQVEVEVARLRDDSKSKDDELLELKRFKQMICELSGASGKKGVH